MLSRILVAAVAAVALVLAPGVLTGGAGGARAAGPSCDPPAVASYDPASKTYTCTIPPGQEPGEPGDPGGPGSGGGSTEPTCDLRDPYTFCKGTQPCRTTDKIVPLAPPKSDPPSEEAVMLVDYCFNGFAEVPGRVYWSDPGEPPEPSLQQQAQTAVGQLDLQLPALRTSPTGRTLVNFPTWFWLDAAGMPEQTGSSAFGLVAIASISELRVDPGDGTGAFTCPWTTSAAEARAACSHTYQRASDGGGASWHGRPAYEATASATWRLRFEVNGTPVTIAGAPVTIDGPASTAVVRVDELQTMVRSVG